MRLLSKTLIIFCFLAHCVQASVPDVVNFGTKDYKSHSINYDFVQDSSGIMYIANAYCVLEYDGSSFRKIPLVAGKSAVSLAKDGNGRIYVGSSSEFGYLTKDESEKTIYKSLKEKIPGDKEFNEAFITKYYKGAIYFMTSKRIYRCIGDSIEMLEGFGDKTYLYNMSITNNELVYWEAEKGIGRIVDDKAEIFIPNPKHLNVHNIEWINNEYVLFGGFGVTGARNDKLFEEANSRFSRVSVSCGLKIDDDNFLVGTVKDGIYLINSKGDLVRHFTTEHGLQDNFIRKLYKDKNGNIWIAYNNGIGILKWSSPIQYITNSQGFDGMGYSGTVFQNKLYIATTQGVYFMDDWENGLKKIRNFTKLEGLPDDGGVNYLTVENGQLIICQASETYALKEGKVKRISPGDWYGSWIWSTAHKYDKNEAFVGNYIGASRYKFENGEWVFKSHIKGFKESSRVLETDKNGVVWAIQGNKGLYKVQLNANRDSAISVLNYSELYKVSPDYFNDIFYKSDTIYITTFGGIYFLKGDSLVKDNSYADIKKYVERARKFDQQGMYGIYKDQPYIVEKRNGKWAIKNSPVSFLRSNLVGSAEFFSKISTGKYLIGTQDGFALYEPAKEQIPAKTDCIIREIELLDENTDSLLFLGKPKESIVLPYAHNNLRFTFTIPAFGEMDQVEYETQLKREGKPLTNWQLVKDVNFREYTNLKEGDYTFVVRAKKGDAVLGNQTYEFTVQPPWYRTTAANAVYLILIIVVGLYIKKRFDKQAEVLKEEKRRELEIKEKLHNAEKLKIELKNKDNELAYMALSYTQKKEMLASVIGKLDSLSKELEHGERNKVNSLKRSISVNVDDESNWDNFQVHFDQKNDNFFQKLKEVDPKLSESYLLFCSYVRMGKSNKEIAELLNISVAAVEKRKYRLKKKWELSDDTSFTDYLKSL